MASSGYNKEVSDLWTAGRQQEEKGDHQGAIITYTKGILHYSRYLRGTLHFSRARAKQAVKDFGGAIVDTTFAFQEDPNDLHSIRLRAEAREELNDFAGMIEDYDLLISKEKNNSFLSEHYYKRGIAEYRLGKVSKAVNDYKEAIKLAQEPNDDLYERCAVAQCAINDIKSAIATCQEAIRHFPANANHHRNLAKFRWQMGNYPGALEAYEAVTRLKESAEAFYNCGVARFKLQDVKGAIIDLEKALRMKKGDYPEANAVLQEARSAYKIEEQKRQELELKQKKKQVEEEKQADFDKALKDIQSDIKASNDSASNINKRYQMIEAAAKALKSVEFFSNRGNFFYQGAKQSHIKVQQQTLYLKAQRDLQTALDCDPFLDEIAIQLEEVELQIAKLRVSPDRMFASAAAKATPKRADLSPAEVRELDKIKERLRGEKLAPSKAPKTVAPNAKLKK